MGLFDLDCSDQAIASLMHGLDIEPDVIFNITMARMLRKLHAAMKADDLCSYVPVLPQQSISLAHVTEPTQLDDATYIDDIALMLTADSCQQLIDKSTAVASLAVDIFKIFAFEVNMKRGKTEVMLNLRGAQKNEYRDLIYNRQNGILRCDTRFKGSIELAVTRTYKHGGGHVDDTNSFAHDVTAHRNAAFQAYRPLAARLFRNQNYAVRSRMTIVESRVLSKMDYNAHVWGRLHKGAEKRYVTSVMQLYRDVACMVTSADQPCHYADEQVLHAVKAVPPLVRLSVARLKYFQRVLQRARMC